MIAHSMKFSNIQFWSLDYLFICVRLRHLRTNLLLVLLVSQARAADAPPTFERDIRPLFARRCTVCHNARKVDDPDVSAGLALDSYDAALRGTKARPVVVPGK